MSTHLIKLVHSKINMHTISILCANVHVHRCRKTIGSGGAEPAGTRVRKEGCGDLAQHSRTERANIYARQKRKLKCGGAIAPTAPTVPMPMMYYA